jgi:hypothetical protein
MNWWVQFGRLLFWLVLLMFALIMLIGCESKDCTSLECIKRVASAKERTARYETCMAHWREYEREEMPCCHSEILPGGYTKNQYCRRSR